METQHERFQKDYDVAATSLRKALHDRFDAVAARFSGGAEAYARMIDFPANTDKIQKERFNLNFDRRKIVDQLNVSPRPQDYARRGLESQLASLSELIDGLDKRMDATIANTRRTSANSRRQ